MKNKSLKSNNLIFPNLQKRGFWHSLSSRLAAKPNATQRICHYEFDILLHLRELISRFEPQIARIITRLPITQPNHTFYFTGEIASQKQSGEEKFAKLLKYFAKKQKVDR